ncbi:MAG: ABC transporter ATP-binding protein [Gammaproteobacteria bacterium]|nr:ABC transporter ATP-binding protein [Gammaproteobacteria bacterium]
MLEIDAIDVAYGGHRVLHSVSVSVGVREFVAIVGPNGAGKSTLFKAVSGTAEVTAGAIRFTGRDLLATPPPKRPHLGIAHVPEGRQVFPSLSVAENLAIGAETETGRRHWHETEQQIYSWFPVLADRRQQAAGTLSGGEQQMLAIGRGLASAPKLLMLDEPSMGLAPAIADEIFERIIAIHEQGEVSVLLVEQRVAEALHYAARAYVFETGRVVLEGKTADIRNDDRIRQAYLGL